jgi:hypothetical protein
MRELETDWFHHQRPVYLKGGKVIKWDGQDEVNGLVQINVPSLGIIQPFTRYRLMVRRHLPVEVLGLPLKFKVVGNVPFDPSAYTGFKVERFNNFGEEVLTCDALSSVSEEHDDDFGDDVRVIRREVLAEIFPAIMYGFGNTATVDDITAGGRCISNEPKPFIEFYVNDEGRFVLMPCHRERRRNQGVVIQDVEVTTMPFTAKSMEIQRNSTEFTHPHSHRSGELFVQGSFEHGRGGRGRGRGFNGYNTTF